MRETLQWLDEATSKYPHVTTLQEADHAFERWADVERFAVPRTLFSEYDHDELETDSEELPAATSSKLVLSDIAPHGGRSSDASDLTGSPSPTSPRSMRSSASPVSPPTSPAKGTAAVRAMPTLAPSPFSRGSGGRGGGGASGTVPVALRSLFNYILWRIHQELDPAAALESFIFLCNDAAKTNHARGFDIKTKRLEQLREAIGREDREYKNRMALLSREHGNNLGGGGDVPASPLANPITPRDAVDGCDDDDDDLDDLDDDDFLTAPPKAPAAMIQLEKSNVMDPHAFGRGTAATAPALEPTIPGPRSPRQNNAQAAAVARGSPRGSHAQPYGSGAGRGGGNGRGGAAGGGRGSVRGGGRGGRGRGGAAAGAAATPASDGATVAASVGQIDPDSFSRPHPRGNISVARGRGAGGGRKLWVPT